ncbi:MAG: Rpn family recombination-promoting nuclease/putative transposase, partial [Saprospiraceae bacterium]
DYFCDMPHSINNIHDKFVRESFSDPNRAVAFFEKFLPEELLVHLELSTLKVLQESYMNEELQEHFSDLVFEVSLLNDIEVKADLVLLFEHKSSPDRHVLIQVGHYMFAHWYSCLSQKKTLKVIIPVIYYQGKQEWQLADLSTLFRDYPEYIKEFVPKLRHIFFALNTISQNKIETMRDAMMAAAVVAQKWRFDPGKLKDDFERIFGLFPMESHNLNFLEMIIVYILNVSNVTEKVLAESITSIPPSIKENIMTTYERITQRSKKEGIIEGEQIGIQKEKIKVVLNCFDQNIAIAMITNITGLSEDEVIKILKEHGKVQ